eukprot:scaffold187990_cov45-Attheya_sp.AAC.1
MPLIRLKIKLRMLSLSLLLLPAIVQGFQGNNALLLPMLGSGRSMPRCMPTPFPRDVRMMASSTPSVEEDVRAKPRTGFAQVLLNAALGSPLWKLVLVPMARNNIKKTAEANGIRWSDAKSWIQSQEGPWNTQTPITEDQSITSSSYPDYYLQEFHSYEAGNLSWESAFEQELAGRAVGARNFPQRGADGEDAFREAFEAANKFLGVTVPDGGTVVDLGCGTGTSTRRLAAKYDQARTILGMDFSPYFIGVGQRLLDISPKGMKEGGPWMTTICPDDRIELLVGDATSTGLSDSYADVVNVGLVVHEMPTSVAKQVVDEALRILKPGGQLWLSEMDFESPGFSEQRSNALLFSLIRSTEPFLDEYADGFVSLKDHIVQQFDHTKICAATGRHFALLATKAGNEKNPESKGTLDDQRFLPDGTYSVADTHLKTWESKKD